MTRYESLALVVAVCIVLMARRRFDLALTAVVAAGSAVTAFGLYAVANGGPFLPNPIMIKGVSPLVAGEVASGNPLAGIVGRFQSTFLADAYPLNYLLIASVILLTYDIAVRRRAALLSGPSALSLITIVTAAGHLSLADIGWLFRYEAYLYALVIPAVITQLSAAAPHLRASMWLRPVLALSLVALLGSAPGLAQRAHQSGDIVPRAMRNIYEQSIQVAGLLTSNPEYTKVALNDLGAVAFFNSHIEVFDLVGLGVRDPALQMSVTKGELSETALWDAAAQNGADVAIVHANWFGKWPDSWTPVASWAVSDNVILAWDKITFVAAPGVDTGRLRSTIQDYARESLPPGVSLRLYE